jgi:hypothetical protein
MTPEEVYTNWRSTLKNPDDSLFYYHPSLERILLGLAIFVLTPQPALSKLGKAEPLKLLHLEVPLLITVWIDKDEATFKDYFKFVMTISEGYMLAAAAYQKKYPSKRKVINEVMQFFACAIAYGGDMNPTLADELLDDLSTDGREIHSEKIKAFGTKLLALTKEYGLDIPIPVAYKLNGW